MASLVGIFSDQEMTNWLKAWLALNITKTGLEDFIEREISKFQSSILQSVTSNVNLPLNSTCTRCLTANLLKCPSQGICKKNKNNPVCTLHGTPNTQPPRPCPNRICDAVRDEIVKAHRYNGPSWKNTSAEQWAINHWEVAKCYMPPDGYESVGAIKDTDFNGIVSVAINCKHFDNLLSFSIAPQQQMQTVPCLLTKARDICKAVRHSPNCKVKSTDLQDYFLSLVTLLSDSRVLAHDSGAQDAVRKLNLLENDHLTISVPEICQLLKDLQPTVIETKQVSEDTKTKLQTYIEIHSEHIENLYSRQDDLEKAIEQVQSGIDSLQHSTEADYDRRVQDFRGRLINHYQEKYRHVAVSPLMPNVVRSLDETYAEPAIRRIVTESDGSRKKTEPVCTYNGVLHTNEQSKRRIFLQGINDLYAKRDEVHKQILQEEEEKQKLQNDIRILTERLAKVNESLSKKMASRNEFDKTIAETEGAYMKILESSQTLLNVLKRESQSLREKSTTKSSAAPMS